MCDPVSATVAVVGGIAASQMMRPPSMPSPGAPPPPPQGSRSPTVGAVSSGMSGTGQAGGSPGVAQTMLTGPGGVSLDDTLLGKKTLLGG